MHDCILGYNIIVMHAGQIRSESMLVYPVYYHIMEYAQVYFCDCEHRRTSLFITNSPSYGKYSDL